MPFYFNEEVRIGKLDDYFESNCTGFFVIDFWRNQISKLRQPSDFYRFSSLKYMKENMVPSYPEPYFQKNN